MSFDLKAISKCAMCNRLLYEYQMVQFRIYTYCKNHDKKKTESKLTLRYLREVINGEEDNETK